MTEIKVGDRVHVEFDGEVQTDVEHGWLRVLDADAKVDVYLPASFCEVIVPPIAVGDYVSDENISQLPVGSVLASTVDVCPWHRNRAGCWTQGRAGDGLTDAAFSCGLDLYRVLRIGGGS